MNPLARATQIVKNIFTNGTEENPALFLINDENIKEQFDRDVCAELKKRFDKRRSERRYLELRWRLWSAFYRGDQFSDINPDTWDIEEIPLWAEYEERNVFNQIGPTIDTQLAEMNKRKNNMRVTPASSSSKDKASANVADRIISSMRRGLDLSERRDQGNMMCLILGSCVWKTVWDSSAGKTVAYIESPMDEEELATIPQDRYIDMMRMGNMDLLKTMAVHEGDVDMLAVSPFEIYPENLNVPCSNNRRIMQVRLLSPDEVFEKWGVMEEGSDNQTYKISSTQFPYAGGAFTRSYSMMVGMETVKNTVRVYEEWEMPSARYPNGRLMIGTDNHLLHYGPLPDRMGKDGNYALPFDVQQAVRTDGFFGMSIIDRLIDPQRALNANKNRIQDYLNRLAIGNLVYEQGSIAEDTLWDFDNGGIMPGDRIPYQQGMDKPFFMQTPPLPPDIYNETKNLQDDINTLAGVSALAKTSTVAPAIDAASAIAGLADQDDTRIGLMVENAQAAYISSTRKALLLYSQNVKYPRMVGALGKDEALDVAEFIGSDLTSFDIRIESEPSAADTIQARTQNILQMLNAGLFNDTSMTPETREAIFGMLDMGDWYALMDPNNADQRRAMRENHKMAIGEPAKILSFDDHATHIMVHNTFRLSAEYEDAVERDPGIAAMFEEHVRQHIANYNTLKKAAQQPSDNEPYTITEAEMSQSLSPQDQQAAAAAQAQGGQQQ
jgi:hypothetical protein